MLIECGSGVPQGSVLDPFLKNVLYDGMLDLEFMVDATTIAFADALELIVGGKNEEVRMRNENICFQQIYVWMKEHELMLILNKTEAVVLKGARIRDHLTFSLGEKVIVPKRSIKYLGIIMDDKENFG